MMPVVGVNRDKLFEALGQTYSEQSSGQHAGGLTQSGLCLLLTYFCSSCS